MLGTASGNQPHLRCNPCKTCRYVTTLRRVCTTCGVSLAPAIFYRRHIHNFTYSSAPLTALVKKTNPWRWTDEEEACFQRFKKKISSTNSLGVPRPKGEIILVTDACDVGGGWYPIPVAGA